MRNRLFHVHIIQHLFAFVNNLFKIYMYFFTYYSFFGSTFLFKRHNTHNRQPFKATSFLTICVDYVILPTISHHCIAQLTSSPRGAHPAEYLFLNHQIYTSYYTLLNTRFIQAFHLNSTEDNPIIYFTAANTQKKKVFYFLTEWRLNSLAHKIINGYYANNYNLMCHCVVHPEPQGVHESENKRPFSVLLPHSVYYKLISY